MDVELDDELLLELELELELKLFSAKATTPSAGVWTARMGKAFSLLIASCPRHPDPRHLTTAARSSSLKMKYGDAIMGCAACMWGYAGHTCTTIWSHRCPNRKCAATCARMPTNCKRCWHPGNEHTTIPWPTTFFNCAMLLAHAKLLNGTVGMNSGRGAAKI